LPLKGDKGAAKIVFDYTVGKPRKMTNPMIWMRRSSDLAEAKVMADAMMTVMRAGPGACARRHPPRSG